MHSQLAATEFPGSDLRLKRVREEVGGNVYRWNEHDLEGCLCPALLRYFDSAPKELWVQLKQAKISQFQADC